MSTPIKEWSAYQTAIFDFVQNDSRNGIVEAVAGSGKSATIKKAFTYVKGDAVVLATIHKSKGLEAPRVFWLGRAECPAKWAKQDWQKEQERNLCYVATTRAQEELHMIELAGGVTWI
jgi:DNA helicase-2/ATP-dependent DNA helicase PcrA